MTFSILAKLDVSAAAQELIDSPQWDAFTLRQSVQGSAHAATKCIPLRAASSFLESYNLNVTRGRTAYADSLPATMALLNRCLAGLNVKEVGNVLAVKLLPKGRILPHVDDGIYADTYERFHIVITSPEGNWFQCGDDVMYPEVGHVFFFNHRLRHTVGNPTSDARIHLIVDVILKD